MPANAGMLFDSLSQIAGYDFVDIGDFADEFLNLLPTGPLNEKFESVGLESLYFINNLGTLGFAIAFYLSLALIILVSKTSSWCRPSCLEKRRQKLDSFVFWNGGISLVFESCLVVFIVAHI